MSKLSEAVNEARNARDAYLVAREGDSGDAEINAATDMADSITGIIEAWEA